MKILCVEDDEGLATLLQRSLIKQHYQVEIAPDGQAGWDLIEVTAYDLILLDWMLPKLSGIEFCHRLRSETLSTRNPNQNTPILLMTALDTVTNKIMGLNAGADDYVVKPFDLNELLARIRALLRRGQGIRSPLLTWGELCLNSNSCEVTYRQQPISLSAKEYELLELFLRNPDQIFSINRLLDSLWTLEESPSGGAVRAHIKGLRQKLKYGGADDPIETVYKLGYRLKRQQATGTHRRHRDEHRDEPAGGEREIQTKNREGEDRFYSISFASASTTPVSAVPPEFWEAWLDCRQFYCDRLSTVQQAVTALQNGTLTPEQQYEAEREAHTLVGSLGSFGLDEASRIARQIQQILKQQTPLGQLEIEKLTQLTTALRSHLEAAKEKKIEKVEITPSSPSLTSAHLPILLIVDEDLFWAQLLTQEALSWGFQAEIAANLKEAQKFLDQHSVDVLLLDLNASDASGSILEFLDNIRNQQPDVSVVVLTAEETFEKRIEAARLGSHCFLQKPIAPSQVLAAVSQVLQQSNQLGARILVVDDDLALLHCLSAILEPCGYQVTLLSQPEQFWQRLEQTKPDLLILDIELCQPLSSKHKTNQAVIPPLSGIELCQVIRSDLRWNRLPILFLSGYTDVETVQRSFAVGADDFLNKPVVAQELLTRVRTRLKQRKLWETTDLDELMGISSRRKVLQDLTQLIQLAQRQQQPLSLAVLDLDCLKHINDQYGQAMGDQMLSCIGKLLHQSFRQEDIVELWERNKFIIGMYGMTQQDGVKRLEEVLHQSRQCVSFAPSSISFQVSFSAGIAQLFMNGNDLQTLYQSAEKALDRAKLEGQNRILTAARSL